MEDDRAAGVPQVRESILSALRRSLLELRYGPSKPGRMVVKEACYPRAECSCTSQAMSEAVPLPRRVRTIGLDPQEIPALAWAQDSRYNN